MFDAIALSPVFSFDDSTQLPPDSLSNLLGKERHCVAESFKLPDRTLCQPGALSFLEIVCSLIPLRLIGREPFIDYHQKPVENAYTTFILSNLSPQPLFRSSMLNS